MVLTGSDSVSGPAGEFLVDLGISTVIGIVAGVVLAAAISSDRTGIWRESAAIAVLTVVTISFFSLDTAGGSGYLGAFLAGLIVGNAQHLGLAEKNQPHAQEVREFAFNLVGHRDPDRVHGARREHPVRRAGGQPAARPRRAGHADAGGAPAHGLRVHDAGPRRALDPATSSPSCAGRARPAWCPAALVGVLAGLGVPNGDVFASVVALAIVLTLVLQALPARWLAGRLGLLEPQPAPPP